MIDSTPSSPSATSSSGPPSGLNLDEAASARSGFLLISGAKVWFLVSATLLNLGLPRFLGNTTLFGDFGTVNSLISILNMVLVTGALQAVSKRVSERPDLAWLVRRKAMRLQLFVGGGLFAGLMVSADLICADLLKDASLAPYLRIAAFITLSYAFYASFIGVLNGLRAFAIQALFDIAFATLKVSLIIGLVLAGFGVGGAFSGFAIAALAVTLGAWWVTHVKTRPLRVQAEEPQPISLLRFMLKVMGFVFAMNILIQGDVVVLKRAAFDAIETSMRGSNPLVWGESTLGALSLGQASPRDLSAAVAGLYRAAKNVSLIPYQGVIALSFVIFPLLSRATFETDKEATRRYVRQALRVSWLLVIGLATLIAAGGEGLAVGLFGDDYKLAGDTLTPMVLAMSALALLYLIGTVLIAASRPMDALLLTLGVALLEMGALYIAVATLSPEGVGADSSFIGAMLMRAAWTTAWASLLALALSAFCLRVRLQIPLPLASILRILFAALVALSVASALDDVGLWAVFVRALIAGVTFLLVLIFSREITREDWKVVSSTLSRRTVS